MAKRKPVKLGRPQIAIIPSTRKRDIKEISLDIVEALCRVNATLEEIAAECGVSASTFDKLRKKNPELKEIMDNASNRGRASLRRTLIARGMKGSDACLIFACKNFLGMSDRVSSELTGRDGRPIQIADATEGVRDRLVERLKQIADAQVIDVTPIPPSI